MLRDENTFYTLTTAIGRGKWGEEWQEWGAGGERKRRLEGRGRKGIWRDEGRQI